MIKGIGPHFAGRLVAAFGENVFDVIEQAPDRLLEVDGIGKTRLARITGGWSEQKAIREIMVFLQSHGVGTSRAVRIFKSYGADAIPLVKENPYRLARDIRGIGFITADQIAQRLGIPKTSMLRARAGISYALLQAVENGDCGLPHEDLLTLGQKLLEIDRPLLEEALALETAEGGVVVEPVAGEPCVFLPTCGTPRTPSRTPCDGCGSADGLARHGCRQGHCLGREASRCSIGSWPEAGRGQGAGLQDLDRHGRAGCRQDDHHPRHPCHPARQGGHAAAGGADRPSRQAALGDDRSRGQDHPSPAGVRPRVAASSATKTCPLECDLLVLDEVSMVDVPLWRSVLKALPHTAALLIVGDVDQLPSVGPGQVLADIIGCGRLPVARLTEIFRQARESRIIVNAHRVNRGDMPELEPPGGDSDFYFVEAVDPEDAPPRS